MLLCMGLFCCFLQTAVPGRPPPGLSKQRVTAATFSTCGKPLRGPPAIVTDFPKTNARSWQSPLRTSRRLLAKFSFDF